MTFNEAEKRTQKGSLQKIDWAKQAIKKRWQTKTFFFRPGNDQIKMFVPKKKSFIFVSISLLVSKLSSIFQAEKCIICEKMTKKYMRAWQTNKCNIHLWIKKGCFGLLAFGDWCLVIHYSWCILGEDRLLGSAVWDGLHCSDTENKRRYTRIHREKWMAEPTKATFFVSVYMGYWQGWFGQDEEYWPSFFFFFLREMVPHLCSPKWNRTFVAFRSSKHASF